MHTASRVSPSLHAINLRTYLKLFIHYAGVRQEFARQIFKYLMDFPDIPFPYTLSKNRSVPVK